jgi:3-oxoacyl-[acyl-carrier protein] reductase
MWRTNVKGILHATAAVAPSMIERGWGRVVNVASAAGVGTSLPGTTLYAATKGAVLILTKRLAFELGRQGITVNAVLPGYTRTDMTMAGRSADEARSIVEMLDSRSMIGRGVADPDEIATVIAFLASPESAFMTGQLLLADGGRMDYLAHV